MLTLAYKLDGISPQYAAIDEGKSKNAMPACTAVLTQEFDFANKLGSQATQAAAERAWVAVERFYTKCHEKEPGKKGYPRFQKYNRSIEYKATAGLKLEQDGKHITFSDGIKIGRLRLIGTRSIETFPIGQSNRVRLIHRADGNYCQFCVDAVQPIEHTPTDKQMGIDLGINAFYADSDGNRKDNLRHYYTAEMKLKQLQQRVSRKKKGSNNRPRRGKP